MENNMLEKKKFVNYTLDEDKNSSTKVISLKLNEEEQALLKQCQEVINQSKDGTAIKTLVNIGAKVVLDEKIGYILETIFKNKRNNKRNNINDFD